MADEASSSFSVSGKAGAAPQLPFKPGMARGISFHVASTVRDEEAALISADVRRSDVNISSEDNTTVQEFWLSCMVQDLVLNSKEETASALVFMKCHVLSPNFVQALTEERCKLVGGAFSELSGADAASRIQGARSDIQHSVTLANPPADVFPINPLHVCRNESTKAHDAFHVREHLCWVRYDLAHQILSVQMAFRIALATPLHFGRFPFDRHVVPLQLATRVFRDAKGHTLKWVLPPSLPAWAEPTAHYSDDRRILSEKVRRATAEFQSLPPVVLLAPEGSNEKPVLCIRLQRKATKFILSVSAPIAM